MVHVFLFFFSFLFWLRPWLLFKLVLRIWQEIQSRLFLSVDMRPMYQFVFLTGGVVFLTLVINGSTTQFLFRFLNMNNTTETKVLALWSRFCLLFYPAGFIQSFNTPIHVAVKLFALEIWWIFGLAQTRILEFVKYEMYSNALEAFGEMGEDEELGPADWITIRKYLSCLSSLPEDGEPAHPHGPPGSEGSGIEYVEQQMQDTRIRFLNGKLTTLIFSSAPIWNRRKFRL